MYPTGDINQDGIVNAIDLSLLVSRWNTNDPDADLNNDGTVNAIDLSLLVSNWGATGTPTGTALLVTNESTLSAGNQALQSRLVSLGYSVTTRLDSAPVDYTGMDVVVFGSITGGNINGKYANPPIGVVSVDSWTHFGLGTAIGFQNTVTTLQVTNTAHPLSGGLSNGNHVVYNTPGYLVWSTNHNTATAITIATNPGQPTQPIVFGYEAGSMMVNHYATTRHVGMGLHKDVRANMTAAGWTLFDAAVAWARASTYVAPPPPAAPTGLTATAGDTQVSLTWNTVAGAASYTIKRSTTSGGPYTTIQSNVTTTSFTNTGLTNGTTYYYVVSAVNTQGESANSSQVSGVPVVGSGGGGEGVFLYSSSQITMFQDRMLYGPYKSTGDAGHGGPYSPGDGDRALAAANAFIANPTSYRWASTVPLTTSSPFPDYLVFLANRAAWCYMTLPNHPNRNAWRDAYKAHLLWHANHANHDFANSNHYPHTYSAGADGPIFRMGGWMRCMIQGYDMLGRDVFTSSERATLDRFFYTWANWVSHWVVLNVGKYSSRISGWLSGDYTSTNSDWLVFSGSLSADNPYDGGPRMSTSSMNQTNRHGSVHNSGAYIAAYLKYHGIVPSTAGTQPSYGWWTPDQIVTRYAHIAKIYINYSLYPHGITGDFHRAIPPDRAWLGVAYSGSEQAAPLGIAKYLARVGDMSVWNYSTTYGAHNQGGSPTTITGRTGFPAKNLHWMAHSYARYYNGTSGWNRRVQGYEMFRTGEVKDIFNSVIAAAVYPTDMTLRNSWRRDGGGFPAYPQNPVGYSPASMSWEGKLRTTMGLIELAP
jgi:hypothetical protein